MEDINSLLTELSTEELPIEDKKKKKNEISFMETAKYVYEQIVIQNEEEKVFKFVRYTKSSDTIDVVDTFTFRGKTYHPIDNVISQSGTVQLPSDTEEYGDTNKLLKEIRDFLYTYFEPPQSSKSIIPHLILFYWLSDKFPFVPYLHFVGLTGTGKSTALETFGSISYKSIKASGAITIASIFRLAHEWRGTLLLDEFELGERGGESYNAMVQLLKAGVQDMPVFRTEGEGKKAVTLYQIKSPRVFSSQEPVVDPALVSRTITVRMSKNTKRLPLYKLDSYYNKAQSIKNKLLLWRLRHIGKINLKDIEFGYEDLSKFDGRTQQVMTPIYYLADDETKKEILEFANEQEDDVKRERRDELDGQVFEYINLHPKEDISVAMITNYINDIRTGKGYKNPLSERKVGNLVRKILQYKTDRRNDGYYLVPDEDHTKKLCEYYGMIYTNNTESDEVIEAAKAIFGSSG